MSSSSFIRVCCCLFPVLLPIAAKQLPDLYWNSSNPIFHNGPGGGANVLAVEIMDSLTIHCPHYDDTTLVDQTQQAIIYRVTKFGYDNCIVDETSQPVAQCSDPFNNVDIRIVFRRFTPLPSGLEYEPGQTYFFISTSDGSRERLNLKQGGLCVKQNMRVQIDIEKRQRTLAEHVPKTIPKFGRPKPRTQHLSNSVGDDANSVDDDTLDGTRPPYWDEFLRKVFEGREGPSFWSDMDETQRKAAISIADDMHAGVYPIIYTTHENDLRANRQLTPDYHPRQVQADDSVQQTDSRKLYEIHEIQDFNLPYRSSGSRQRSFCQMKPVLCLTLLLISAVRWLS